MISDKTHHFSEAQDLQSLTVSGGATPLILSDATYDLALTKTGTLFEPFIGEGKEIEIVTQVTTAIAGNGADIRVDLVTADDAALSVNLNTLKTALYTMTPGASAIAIGTRFRAFVPRETLESTVRRFIGIRYQNTDAAAEPTQGGVDTFMSYEAAPATIRTQPSGLNFI